MADNTQLFAGSGGDVLKTEDIGAYKIGVSKIYVGTHGVDGGPVTDANAFPVKPGTGATWAVTGTFWQATQPVSGTMSVANFPATQPISAASLPLPSGAATEGGNLATIAGKDFATDAHLVAMSGKLPATLGQHAMAASMSVVFASDQAPITATATPVPPIRVSVSFTRPNDTTPYTTGDAIAHLTAGGNNYLTLAGMVNVAGGTGRITRIWIEDSAKNSPTPIVGVSLYGTAPAAAVNDNAAFGPTSYPTASPDQAGLICPKVTLSNFLPNASNGTLDSGPLYIPFKGLVTTDGYAVLTMDGTSYTPSAVEGFVLNVDIEPDHA